MARFRIDWGKYTKEFVRGNFKTIAEYKRYNNRMREVEGETERPKDDSINKMSRRLGWKKLKKNREDKRVQNIVSKGLDKVSKKEVQKMIDSKTAVNQALLKLIVHYANHPEQLQVRADLSDLVNDAKRGLGMKTKEAEQAVTPSQNLTQVNVNPDSFRSQLESTKEEKLVEIEQGVDDELNDILSQIPQSSGDE